MLKSVYEYRSYKSYLAATLDQGGKRSGRRAKLARHLGCQSAHVSQVLNGDTHFSFEQTVKINSFLGHDREESHFFFLLVSTGRSGTHELTAYYRQQIDEILRRRSILKNRVQSTQEIPREHQARYFSSWLYSALHMAVAIPELQSKEALSHYFHLPLPMVGEVVEFLLSIGLILQEGGRLNVGPGYIHLDNEADNIQHHHMNWRVQALESLPRKGGHDLHYSAVFSLSKEDAGKLKENMMAMIKANLEIVSPSPAHELYCSCLDFFEMKK